MGVVSYLLAGHLVTVLLPILITLLKENLKVCILVSWTSQRDSSIDLDKLL